MIKMVGFSML